jgi:hypothetical protein
MGDSDWPKQKGELRHRVSRGWIENDQCSGSGRTAEAIFPVRKYKRREKHLPARYVLSPARRKQTVRLWLNRRGIPGLPGACVPRIRWSSRPCQGTKLNFPRQRCLSSRPSERTGKAPNRYGGCFHGHRRSPGVPESRAAKGSSMGLRKLLGGKSAKRETTEPPTLRTNLPRHSVLQKSQSQ